MIITVVVHVDDIFAFLGKEGCDEFGRDLNTTVPVNILEDSLRYSGLY